jgi:Aspartyl protease
VVVPLELLQGRPVVSLTVNGAGPFRFLIDPAASSSQLDVRLIEELKLRAPERRNATGPSATADSRFVDLQMGTLALSGVEVQPVDMASIVPEFTAATRPRGLLGGSVWGEQLLTIDYPTWRVALAPDTLPEADGKDIFTLAARPADKAVGVTVAGTRVACELDLQSTAGLILPETFAKTLTFVKPPADAGSIRTRYGVLNVSEAQLADNAVLASAVFVRPVIQFTPQATVPIVGTAWLQDFALIFDLKNRRVRLAHRRH